MYTQEARQTQQFAASQENDDEIWWTDRTYRGRGNLRGRSRGFFHQMRNHGSRGNPRNNFGGRGGDIRQKKYYIYS